MLELLRIIYVGAPFEQDTLGSSRLLTSDELDGLYDSPFNATFDFFSRCVQVCVPYRIRRCTRCIIGPTSDYERQHYGAKITDKERTSPIKNTYSIANAKCILPGILETASITSKISRKHLEQCR